MNETTGKRQLLPNRGRIICDVEGRELLPKRNFRPFYNAGMNPKFLTHPEYFKIIAARFSSGGQGRVFENLKRCFDQVVKDIYTSDPEAKADYADFEHRFYDYAYDQALEPFQGDTGWKEEQRKNWQREKAKCDSLVGKEVPKEHLESAKIFTYLVILMWRRPLSDIVSRPYGLLKQWGNEKAIDISRGTYVFSLGRGDGKFNQKLLYNSSGHPAFFILRNSGNTKAASDLRDLGNTGANFALRVPENTGGYLAEEPDKFTLLPGECLQAVFAGEDVISGIRQPYCFYTKNRCLVKAPMFGGRGVRWVFRKSPGNKRWLSEGSELKEEDEANPAADPAEDVSFAWDGSILQIRDGQICGLETLGEEVAFPSVIRRAQKNDERFIQLYYTESLVAALSETGKLYCTGFSVDRSDGYKVVSSVQEYDGELYYLTPDASGWRLESTATDDDLSAFRIVGLSDEASFWFHMSDPLRKTHGEK